MPVILTSGDILSAPETVILHGCNALGKFNSGVARVVRDNLPEAYAAYMKAYGKGELVPGKIIWARSGNIRIANAITQADYGRDPHRVYVDYDAVRQIMRTLNSICERSVNEEAVRNWFGAPVLRVAMPFIGTGLGNGNREKIRTIIEEESHSYTAVIYTPENTA